MNITKHFTHSFCILHSAFCIAAITSLMSAAFAADISDVIVRQQWPWSTDIKVEFKLTNMTGPVTVNVEAFDGDTPLDSTNLKAAIVGDLWGITESGVHTFVIKPAVAFGTERNAIADFKVRLSLTDQPNANDIIYKIVDLISPYTVTDVKRNDLMNGKFGKIALSFSEIDPTFTTSLDDVLIWLDVTNEVYKTDKMVFRRIPAAGKTFLHQGNANHEVTFTHDFYAGVFEVTQKQFKKFKTITFGESTFADMRPATCVAVTHCRPNAWNTGAVGGAHVVSDTATLCGNMQSKTGLLIDIPTEVMWEYACRAGTTAPTYTGLSTAPANYGAGLTLSKKIMRALNCNTDADGGTSGTQIVGMYKPNAWGLYDMLGNVGEPCLDVYVSGSYASGADPIYGGPSHDSSAYDCVQRGGQYDKNPSYLVPPSYSQSRTNRNTGYGGGYKYFGVRLYIYCEHNADGTL